jgi:hypothetical protein
VDEAPPPRPAPITPKGRIVERGWRIRGMMVTVRKLYENGATTFTLYRLERIGSQIGLAMRLVKLEGARRSSITT